MQSMNLKRKIWQILIVAVPEESTTRIVNCFLLVLILLNVVAVILGTVKVIEDRFGQALFLFEVFSVAVFTIEYVARVWSCVSSEKYANPFWGRVRFLFSPMALIDLLAVLPFYLAFVTYDLRFLRALRIFRLVRIAKLGRYSSAMRLLGQVLVKQKEELIITVMIMGLLVVLASSLIYFAEHEAQPDNFPDIPSAMWWSIVTLTTVGYGDVYPVTVVGKLFAACVAIFGVGMVALPTGILGAGFIEEIRRQNQPASVCPHCGKELDGEPVA